MKRAIAIALLVTATTLSWAWPKTAYASDNSAIISADASVIGITQTATVTPAWYNGNWFPYSARTTADTTAIQAQTDAYKAAKTKGDLGGEVSNGFWPSVQAWSFNRAARSAINRAEGATQPDHDSRLKEALSYIDAGLTVLSIVAEASAPAGSTDQAIGAFKNEHNERARALAALNSNRLFIRRLLGIDPWPEHPKWTGKGVSGTASN